MRVRREVHLPDLLELVEMSNEELELTEKHTNLLRRKHAGYDIKVYHQKAEPATWGYSGGDPGCAEAFEPEGAEGLEEAENSLVRSLAGLPDDELVTFRRLIHEGLRLDLEACDEAWVRKELSDDE